ncbi:Mrp/NBP35 family ATP-binding protein [Paenibacillus mendelii]|uniref:Iron-sulfur cluster carrier protein n=1 Tax=Paenibacillus mendelii TaxID=206163 RepID=A0ABV6JBC7_9BACL|nr:Mrp/NBP35 family ATP-binding protein [Paenibacillus mendelii]MCQ6558577.1 Mrp/NBP35 family ATP-binding protein [Paenibacillus mendelii]
MQREQVQNALAELIDEESGRPFLEAGLIRDVMVNESYVALTLLLHSEESGQEDNYRAKLKEILGKIGVPDVHVRFKVITKQEKDEIASGGGATTPKTARIPAAKQALAPIASPDSGVQFLAIASGKGGVGKSTVTVNLASALHRAGKRVGIIDADIYGFSIPRMLGIEEVRQTDKNNLVPIERYGMHIISTGFFVSEHNPVIWRGPMLGKMLNTFLNEVKWPELDYMIIDLPPGTGDVALDVNRRIPQCSEIIVTTPHATASGVATRAGAMAIQTEHRILGVVENMSYYEDELGKKHYLFGRSGGIQLAERLQTELLAQIPIDTLENEQEDPDFSTSIYKPDTKNGSIYSDLAQQVIKQLDA